MQKWVIPEFGIDKLERREAAIPEPGPAEVVVEVHACSLNYRDLMTVRGEYDSKLALPRVPLSDGAGVVHSVGGEVTRVSKGDRVAAIFMQNWLEGQPSAAKYKGALGGDINGMASQYVALPAEGVVRLPDQWSFAEAAALPCAYVTAWSALHKAVGMRGPVGPGTTVLILGTGGVSIAALQLANAMGARVLGTSGSDEKLERAQSLGLHAGVNYRTTPDWAKWAMQQTDGAGVDLVIEVGGQGTFAKSLAAASIGGAVAEIGVLASGGETPDVRVILRRQLRVQGIYVGSRADFEAMNSFLTAHAVTPFVDRSFAPAELPQALQTMQDSGHFGKLVVEMQ